MDHFKQNKTLKNTKKRLKHRFWTEVYNGAKLFYLSGLVNGKVHAYLRVRAAARDLQLADRRDGGLCHGGMNRAQGWSDGGVRPRLVRSLQHL